MPTGQFLGPACEIESRSDECRCIKIALAGIEHIDPGVGQRPKQFAEAIGGIGQLRAIVLHLELGKAQEDRQVFADLLPDRANDLGPEGRATGGIAAPPVVAPVIERQ